MERVFGDAKLDSAFLLGSITKPIALAAVMHLFEQGKFQLDDLAVKFLPEFTGEARDTITLKQPDDPRLWFARSTTRKCAATARTLESRAVCGGCDEKHRSVFSPGSRYQYSSMAILLACEIAQRISGRSILELVEQHVVTPLAMEHSALGYGRLKPEQTVRMQTEHAAPEAGGGDPTASSWDWNSAYWRKLGAPWGGMHASAGDVLKFLDAFLKPPAGFLSPATRTDVAQSQCQRACAARVGFRAGSHHALARLQRHSLWAYRIHGHHRVDRSPPRFVVGRADFITS